MLREQLKAKLRKMKGELKEQWGRLTDDDLEMIGGEMDKLSGKLGEYYNWSKEEVKDRVQQFLKEHDLVENGNGLLKDLGEAVESSKEKIKEVAQDAQEETAELAKSLNNYLKERPLVTAALGAVAALALVVIASR